jgi:hypothetical protein
MSMKKIITVLLFLLPAASLHAQKLTATVSRNKLAAGENFELTFALNADGTAFKAPNLSDFIVYYGPNLHRNVTMVNGNVSQFVSYSYMLAPKKEGKFTIGPASMIVNGKKVMSDPVTIEVKGSFSPHNPQQQQQQQQQQSASPPSKNLDDNLFVRTLVNKRKAYLGEQIIVTHKVYTRLDLEGFKDVKYPAYTGFWAQDVPQKQYYDFDIENIDGIRYSVAEIKKSFLFAQRTGKIELAPIEAQCIVLELLPGSQWGAFERYREVVYTIKSKPVAIEIVPLPEEGKPDGFSGAVGEFSFQATIDKQKTKANEPVNLSMIITGSGNIKLIDPMGTAFPEGIETYSPKIDDDIVLSSGGVSGSKTIDYLLVPRKEGTYTLGGNSFSYFDPRAEKYITIPSPEFVITVDKGDPNYVQAPRDTSDEQMLGKDIRYIKTGNIILTPGEKHFFGSPLFITGMTAPFAAFFLFLFLRKKHIERNSDIAQVKSRKATRMARKRLGIAEQHMQAGNKEKFYDEIFRALYGYLSDKLNIPVADLSKESISAALMQKNVPAGNIERLRQTIETCEFVRYAPSAAPGDLGKVYADSVDLITKLEEETR